ncbi:uncharacterized protein SPPG_08398 [Spizellomyces punctatus DAOM BR117]|uniref:Uncharacterized protein n=1 Tax=Spizellomyces punctatus (strain DAOM BR117) TaxID=645134 RepID=A0A0L0H5K3_SPIPD|nr:uncharacterized protein SPPG_08398 [Spizellomyces punctatus DAOM BR117]KNC96244.1 hypothetical protein SPPG_08398 [Spizellomyces punctatus DAOM BR117]|eukprot:XP_016604284.1 hypothetical protein SPPG_08398 [Spizellomyces punctatus DAOM BR117]
MPTGPPTSPWPRHLFNESGQVESSVLASLEESSSQVPQSTLSLTDILNVPTEFIVHGVRNKCEAALLLDIGHCGFKLDRLMEWERERAYREKVITDCKDAVAAISLPIEDYPIPVVLHRTFTPSLPILSSALTKVRQQQRYLLDQMNQTLSELARHRAACAQFAEVNMGMAREISCAGVTGLAVTKYVLADVQHALVSRILSIMSGADIVGDDAKSWDVLLEDLRQRRTAEIHATSSSPGAASEGFRKRKRGSHSPDVEDLHHSPRKPRLDVTLLVPETPFVEARISKATHDPPSSVSPAGSDMIVVDETTHVSHAVSSASTDSPSLMVRKHLKNPTTVIEESKTDRDSRSLTETHAKEQREMQHSESLQPHCYPRRQDFIQLEKGYVRSNTLLEHDQSSKSKGLGGSFIITSTPLENDGSRLPHTQAADDRSLRRQHRDTQGSNTTMGISAEGCAIEMEMPSIRISQLSSQEGADADNTSQKSSEFNDREDVERGDGGHEDNGEQTHENRSVAELGRQISGVRFVARKPEKWQNNATGHFSPSNDSHHREDGSQESSKRDTTKSQTDSDPVSRELYDTTTAGAHEVREILHGHWQMSQKDVALPIISTIPAEDDDHEDHLQYTTQKHDNSRTSSHCEAPAPPLLLRRVRSEVTPRQRHRTFDPMSSAIDKENAEALLDEWSPVLTLGKQRRGQSAPPSPNRATDILNPQSRESRVLREAAPQTLSGNSNATSSSLDQTSGTSLRDQWSQVNSSGDEKRQQAEPNPTPSLSLVLSLSPVSPSSTGGKQSNALKSLDFFGLCDPSPDLAATGADDQENRYGGGTLSSGSPRVTFASSPHFYTCAEVQHGDESSASL